MADPDPERDDDLRLSFAMPFEGALPNDACPTPDVLWDARRIATQSGAARTAASASSRESRGEE